MQKTFVKAQIALICFLVICVNIKSTIDSYNSFYHDDPGEAVGQDNFIYRSIEKLSDFKPIDFFLSYTGLETGYGFFAPNVASEFLTEFILRDNNGEVIEERTFIPLQTKEGMLRLSGTYTNFLEYIKSDTSTYEMCDVILNSLSMNVLRSNSDACSIETNLFLYHHPTLREKTEDPEALPRLIFVKKVAHEAGDLWENP